MSDQNPNQIQVDLLAATAVNPWVIYDSSSRLQMLGSHLSQALVIKGCEPRRNQTLAEREFGKATFNIRFPCNAEVLAIVDKYHRRAGRDAIEHNPLTVIIFENRTTREIDVIEVPVYHSLHQHFGFKYDKRPAYSKVHVGGTVAEGTIIADSPAVDEAGDYSMGLEANIAFMTIPGVTEDGVVISRSLSERLETVGFESRSATWGKQWYPLNLYGTETDYKPIPDIGQKIRDDGLLFALRKYDTMMSPVEMTPAALMIPDYTFDKLVYAKPNATVIDISVRSGSKGQAASTPVGMDTQIEKYFDLELSFYERLIAAAQDIRRKRGHNVRFSPKLHHLIFTAMMFRPNKDKQRATHIYQRTPMDDWRVEVTFEYDIPPTDGFKLTDLHGGKGVVCEVWEDEDMPIDQNGVRADAIMDGDSTIKRMNIGRMYEHYINRTSSMISERVQQAMAASQTDETVEYCWNILTNYYQIVSPKMHAVLTGPEYRQTHRHHVEAIVKDGVYLYMPTDNQAEGPTMIKELMERFPLNITPVVYRGRSGNVVTTKDSVLIGSLYVILLEKTGDDFSAVASAKLQHFGIPAKLTKGDRYANYARTQPVRLPGETEVRLMIAYMGPEATARLLEMSNNPRMHKNAVTNLLRADEPTNIQEVVDSFEFPVRGSRSQTYISHVLECAGIRFTNTPFLDASWNSNAPPVVVQDK